jgi:hypothetical protein
LFQPKKALLHTINTGLFSFRDVFAIKIGRECDEENWLSKESDNRRGILKELMHMTIAIQTC